MRSTWAILTITGLGAFIAALDQTVVVTALPSVMLDLKIPITELDRVSWIITAYLLGYTVAMPLIGRLGDVYGYPAGISSLAGSVLHRHHPGSRIRQLRVDDWGAGHPGHRRRRHGSHRHGAGGIAGSTGAAGAGPGRRGRRG